MKHLIIALLALAGLPMSSSAQPADGASRQTVVTAFNLAGPFAVAAPMAFDTVDVKGKAFDPQSLLAALPHDAQATTTCTAGPLPALRDSRSVGVLSFYVNNTSFLKAKLNVKGPKSHKLYVDGVETGPDLKLAPEHHTIAIKYLAEPSDSDSICVTIEELGVKSEELGGVRSEELGGVRSEELGVKSEELGVNSKGTTPNSSLLTPNSKLITLNSQHPYMGHDLFDGRRVRGVSLSPDGSCVCVSYQTTQRDGTSQWSYELREVKSGRLINCPTHQLRWMPRSMAAIEETRERGQRVLYKVNPLNGERQRWAAGLPDGSYTISPTEDYIIINVEEEGTKEDADVFEVLEMDDRQPNWRKRTHLVRYDVKTGIAQRITFGNRNVALHDITSDGQRLLVFAYYSRLTKRPTSVADVYVMDQQTLKTDTLFTALEFVDGADFGPDGSKILFRGNPEAFDRVGCQLPPDVTPSMTENELFVYDMATRKVTPLTRDFDPSVNSTAWSSADGMVYFSGEDRDYVRIYRLNPLTGDISQLPIEGDYAYRFDMAEQAPVLAYLSYTTMEPASAYILRSDKRKVINDKLFDGKTALGDALLGTCQDWNFTNSQGDTVYGRLYLPRDFDPDKKYPLIVYYYGGCSPVSRYFESPYAPQYWNSLGYVAYILQPSGATGFGQEWASRHVNTAGGLSHSAAASASPVAGGSPAGDIIEGVKRLCDEHPFINREKIGCMGASYGGFMTQYLQTVTDIFACAVSHAGIANHTSYWGEGYWGYNYSEVSMANSYPWSHRQLYVDQSPLFNADKINTPLLLLHGNADTNVPLIESLQMFTALKLLGREVALVEVQGENHHILDYKKREKWLATQMAWFQKWLKDDPSWWDALYPKKNL